MTHPIDKDRQLADVLRTAEAFRVAMIESGAVNHVRQDCYIEQLRALERALQPLNYLLADSADVDAGAVGKVEAQLLSLVRGEFSSLHISLNDCSGPNYQSVAQAIESGTINEDTDWVSEDSKARAIATNRHWDIHWYPKTPVGFDQVSGATLAEVVEAALKQARGR